MIGNYFMRCLFKAIVKHGGRALADLVPGGQAMFEIGKDVYKDYVTDAGNGGLDLRSDVEGLAKAPIQEVRQAAAEIAAQEGAGLPEETRLAVISYLDQLQPQIRLSLRRPDDPSGTSIPADYSLQKPEDLLDILPRGRKEQTMKVLQRHGLIKEGTEIELMPDAILDDGPKQVPNVYRAHIGNMNSQKSVIWANDSNAYSLTALSVKLEQYGLWWVRPKTFELWQIVGQKESMWDQADRLR